MKDKNKNRIINLIIGIIIFSVLYWAPLSGISKAAQTLLALSAMTLYFWCTNICANGYVSGLYLVLIIVLGVADTKEVFSCWSEPTIWLVVGAYLMCAGIRRAGIGERIAVYLMKHIIRGYKSTIFTIMLMHIVLALLIPHPWPRMFLIYSVVDDIIKNSGVDAKTGKWIKFSVAAFSCPTSFIFLTSDPVLTNIALNFAGVEMTWLRWFVVVGIPALVMCAFTMLAFLLRFNPKDIEFHTENMASTKIDAPFTAKDKLTLAWLVVALVLWALDFAHGIPLGWVTLGIAMLMSLPGIGVLEADDWKTVPIGILVLVTAVMALSGLGQSTGMNEWLVTSLLPAVNIKTTAAAVLFITVCTMLAHTFMGSAVPVLCVMATPLMAIAASAGLGAFPAVIICYIASATHFILPFHHLNLAIVADNETSFSSVETLRFAPILTISTIVVISLVFVPWWGLFGAL